MISHRELLLNISYNVFGWHPVSKTSYFNNQEISKTRSDILYNNLQRFYSPLSMGELEWCCINENEIRREYSGLENYHHDKFSHKRMDIIMTCLLLSLLPCLIVACLTEFVYFFFYIGLMGLILYIYGYKLWNKIQGANLLKYNITQIEEHRKTEAKPEPLVQKLTQEICTRLDAFANSLESVTSQNLNGIQEFVKNQTETILDSITDVREQIELQTITQEKVENISETNPLNGMFTCLNILSSSELLDINDTSILNHEFNSQYIFTISQSQLTFLLILLVRNNKISLAHRKQTKIAKLIAEKFYYYETNKLENKHKNINYDAFAKELNKFFQMDITAFKDKYNDYKSDLRYFYEVFNLKI